MEEPFQRALRLTFELRVPKGLRSNVHLERVEQAVARFIGVVQGLAHSVFPWADKMTATSEWVYVVISEKEEISLPPTERNTVNSGK